MNKKLIVTRHKGLVDYLISEGIVETNVEVVAHATPENVRGRHVIGVLPHSLSCLTEKFTEIPLQVPPELRGVELTEADVRKWAAPAVTYKIEKI